MWTLTGRTTTGSTLTRRCAPASPWPGRGVSLLLRWEQAAAFCPLTRPTCALPPGNVGATRWVAHKVRRVHWDRVGSCGADVHNGARATHRVAPTSPAYSRVRYAHEHGTATGVSVVGAVREPPLQCPAMLRRNPGEIGWERGRLARTNCPPTRAKRRGAPKNCPPVARSIHPHPALRAGLSLAGRGVSLLLRWKQPAAFCPLTPPSKPYRQAM